MRKLALEIAAALALTLGAILALAGAARASDITVTGAYARASATSTATSATAYFTVVNTGAEADRLVAIASDAAGMVMLHETAIADGVATMRHVEAVTIAPGEALTLAPAGLHAMLMDLKGPLKKGGSIPMTLSFEKAGDVSIIAKIGGVAQDGPLD
jgi:periplasmic copper chaperone A